MNIDKIVKAYLKVADAPNKLPITVPPSLNFDPLSARWIKEALTFVKKTYGLKARVKEEIPPTDESADYSLGMYGILNFRIFRDEGSIHKNKTHHIPTISNQGTYKSAIGKVGTITPQEAWEVVFYGYNYITALQEAEKYQKNIQSTIGLAFNYQITMPYEDQYHIKYTAVNRADRSAIDIIINDQGTVVEDIILHWKNNPPQAFWTFEDMIDSIPEEHDDMMILFQDKKYVSALKKRLEVAIAPLKLRGMNMSVQHRPLMDQEGFEALQKGVGARYATNLRLLTDGNTWDCTIRLDGGSSASYYEKRVQAAGVSAYLSGDFICVDLNGYPDVDSLLDDITKTINAFVGQA